MASLIFHLVSFFVVVVVSSSFELYSAKLDLAVDNSKFKCSQEGRFNHPDTCGVYIECVRNSAGSFKRRFGSCHGGIFSDKVRHCMQHDVDSVCKRSSRNTREINSDQKLSSVCSTIQNGFVCADCKTTVNCVDGVAYPSTCGAGDMCDERPEFGGAVCYPGKPEACACLDEYEFHVDNYNPQMFFYCNSIGAEPDVYQCPENRKFDDVADQCTNEMNLPECTAMGDFALQSNCSHYYTCIRGKHGWVQKPFTCDSGFMFNEITGNCEDPCSWNTGLFTCQEEGRFPDPMSCQHYYECIQQDEGFRQYRRQCPSGSQWDKDAKEGHGHCVANSDNTCTPVTVNKCSIPRGICLDVVTPATSTPENNELTSALTMTKEEIAPVNSDIEDQIEILEVLRSTHNALLDLNLSIDLVSRTEKNRQITPILVTVDEYDNMMIAPYCPSGVNFYLYSTTHETLRRVLFDLEEALNQDANSIRCFNEVIASLANFLNGDTRVFSLSGIHDYIINTTELVSATIEEVEEIILVLVATRDDLVSQLAEIEANLLRDGMTGDVTELPTATENSGTVASRLITNRNTATFQRNPLSKSAGMTNQPSSINNRRNVMSRGTRRSRSD